MLEDGMREVERIDKNYPQLMKLFNEANGDPNKNILVYFKREIERNYDEVSIVLEQMCTHESAKLQLGVSHARALGKIDSFIKQRFSELSFEYEIKIFIYWEKF